MIKVNSKKLLAGLKKLSGVINNPSIPVLANVRIIAESGKVDLIGTNLNQSAKVSLACEVIEKIDTTINFKKLHSITNQLNNDDVVLSEKDETASIKCGKSKFKLSCIDSGQWPSDEVNDEYKELDISLKSFRDQINQVFYSSSKDESRPVLNGVLLEFIGNEFNSVATDGRRLSVSSINDLDNSDLDLSIICPVNVLNDICRNCTDSINLKIYESRLSVQSGDYEISTKLIEGNYPNYKQIIPKSFKGNIKVNRSALLDAVQRVSLILDNAQESIKLVFKKNELNVTAQTQDSATESIPVTFGGEETFNFNPLFLIDILKNTYSESIDINYNDSISPTSICSNNLNYILMPMRGGN